MTTAGRMPSAETTRFGVVGSCTAVAVVSNEEKRQLFDASQFQDFE